MIPIDQISALQASTSWEMDEFLYLRKTISNIFWENIERDILFHEPVTSYAFCLMTSGAIRQRTSVPSSLGTKTGYQQKSVFSSSEVLFLRITLIKNPPLFREGFFRTYGPQNALKRSRMSSKR